MRTNRVLLAAAASVLAFALTGCGSEDGGAKVPTAGGGSASSGTGSGSGSGSGKASGGGGEQDEIAAYVATKREWVACMRDHGIDLPDPDSLGRVETGDNRSLKQNPKFTTASEKCKEFSVAVPAAVEKAMRPKLTPEQIKIQREYADCMQKNGAADFPDPDADGYEPVDNDGTPDWDQTSAGAKRAARTCAPIIGDPVEQGPGKG
ncbi:hypothetical protein J7E93_01440 [Streptomyces sp. ISL-36]|uniref:hypothetical protein n=1 Tax=Streptomyces sp. ISL-36 TaxID=2819182 RepID=UPI001BE92F78|nr:hypothetical protein [Streptomyces sp. ISL-36]MBT2438811.1 hypothetical protein [Streptomyces sp. ISL-36]